MHGTGRAIDVFVQLDGTKADNDLGDPIANWLVENATSIGVQFVIWDRTKWNGSYSGRKDRSYGGPHPHHDHLHIELTAAGANAQTPWFQNGGASMSGGPAGEPTPTSASSGCTNTCQWAGDGECDDGGPGAAYSVCGWGTDCMDCGMRTSATAPPGGGTDGTGSDGTPTEPPSGTSTTTSGTCTNTCEYAHDGECDDGGSNAMYSVCALGTDCADCGTRSGGSSAPSPPAGVSTGNCTNTCEFARDGICDDGGPGSEFSDCTLGTDCDDCGSR